MNGSSQLSKKKGMIYPKVAFYLPTRVWLYVVRLMTNKDSLRGIVVHQFSMLTLTHPRVNLTNLVGLRVKLAKYMVLMMLEKLNIPKAFKAVIHIPASLASIPRIVYTL